MKLNQALLRLRKSTLLLVLMILVSLTAKFIGFILEKDIPETKIAAAKSSITSYICTNIVQKRPVDLRDSFFENERRVYYYTKSDSSILNGQHTWYNGNIIAKKHKCSRRSNLCISSISRSELTKGNWSVDFFTNKKLLDSKQFVVKKKPLF